MPINRRKVLGGAGLAGAAAATGVGVDRLISDGTGYSTDKVEPMSDDAARFGDPRLPAETITSQSHLFHLGAQTPPRLTEARFSRPTRTIFRYSKVKRPASCCSQCSPEVSASRTGIVGDQPGHQRSRDLGRHRREQQPREFRPTCRRHSIRAPGFLPLLREPGPRRLEDSDHPEHQRARSQRQHRHR
jgi:hypothetical protein